VNRKGALGVGLWTPPLSLQPQKLSRKGYSFDNIRRSVFWREDTVRASKGREKTGFPLNLDTKHSLNLCICRQRTGHGKLTTAHSIRKRIKNLVYYPSTPFGKIEL
jgi:hypothetical protein